MKKELKQLDLYPEGVLPRVKTSANYKNYPPDKGEVNELPSETVPNQSMTVIEMIKRHAAGLPLDGNTKVPLYYGEDSLPDISNMDLADQQSIIEAVADQLADIKNKIALTKKTKEQKEALETIEFEVQKRLKSIQEQVKAPAPSAGQNTENNE